jgi:REP element-mobilizing transposase RayT
MGLRYKDQDIGETFFVTTSFIDHNPWANIKGVYEALAAALTFRLAATDARLIAYVFMPSHLHLILATKGRALSAFMRDFKKYTAQKSLINYCKSSKIWQDRYDRQIIVTHEVLSTKMQYIHNNPVKAGLVDSPEKWPWSSAVDYSGGKSPVPIWMDWR